MNWKLRLFIRLGIIAILIFGAYLISQQQAP